MVMEIRKDLRKYYVPQKLCPVCKDWPPKERKARRLEIEDVPWPKEKICIRCLMEWCEGFHRYWALHPPKRRRPPTKH